MIYYFSITLVSIAIVKIIIGSFFALDRPNYRKHHRNTIPQIGGLIFAPLVLFMAWWSGLAPQWYIVVGGVSILLGAVDDHRNVSWQIKFTVQLALVAYLSMIFWDRFEVITFYNLSFSISQFELLVIFLFWFIGIYNSVNLLDGLDGLAGGYMLLLCLGVGLSGSGPFATLNLIFAVILLGFLVFNQRPAKLFMGDAGSLFLGFHTAVLPLLFLETTPSVNTLNMTPFVLLASYLIADTTRVFITRLLTKKNPMTADTIHFHHIVLQQSGSYLYSIGSIFFVASLSFIGAMISIHSNLSTNVMLIHLGALLFFILMPPVETYVPLVGRALAPLYNWQKSQKVSSPFFSRTLFMISLFIGLIVSLYFNSNLTAMITWWQHGLSILLLLIFIFFYRKDQMTRYVIQLGLVLFFAEFYWNNEFDIITKLLTTFLLLSCLVFFLEKRTGSNISKFSVLDLLMIFSTFGGGILALLNYTVSIWYFLTMISIWFSTAFILRRTICFTPKT